MAEPHTEARPKGAQSPIRPILERFVLDAWIRLEREQLAPWAFFGSDGPTRVRDFYGKQIQYEGIRFEGSPQTVFWSGYIEPFIQDIASRSVELTLEECRKRHLDPRASLEEARGLLLSLSTKSFARMSDIDRRLRGRGFPDRVERRDTTSSEQAIARWINARVDGELAALISRSGSRWARVNAWFNAHPLLGFAISTLIALASVVLAFFAL